MLTKSSVQIPRPCWLGALTRGQSVGWLGRFVCLFFSLLLLFSCSVISVSLWPHGPQHTRLPCPSPSPGACSNLCPESVMGCLLLRSPKCQALPGSWGLLLKEWGLRKRREGHTAKGSGRPGAQSTGTVWAQCLGSLGEGVSSWVSAQTAHPCGARAAAKGQAEDLRSDCSESRPWLNASVSTCPWPSTIPADLTLGPFLGLHRAQSRSWPVPFPQAFCPSPGPHLTPLC